MTTNAFKGIGFTLPQKNRLKVAADIGVMCGNAWYERALWAPMQDYV